MRWCTYAGGLGRRTDLMTVARAAQRLDPETSARLRVIICGNGDLQESIAEVAANCDSLVYAGRRNAAEIRTLMEQCDFGIIAYRETSDYMMSYPNKLGEFLSYGLPVLTGLGGITWSLLERTGLGTRFAAGDPDSCARALTAMTRTPNLGSQRETALAIHHSMFNPEVVYPAFARHAERVAEEGRSVAGRVGR